MSKTERFVYLGKKKHQVFPLLIVGTFTTSTKMEASDIPRRFYTHADRETQQPVIQPLKSLIEVEWWQPGYDFMCRASIELKPRCSTTRLLPDCPRTLLCHDMKGGYLEDRFVQGVRATDCYRFYYWASVDVFVYFSHYFVTIPPPCWTNAAHTNGIPVLGTVITEREEGKRICEEFLRTEQTRLTFVHKLVSIAKYYRFDGWLLNIENEIPEEDVTRLRLFVKELTEAMKRALPFALVLWYDSVTTSGKLDWQNELNEKNGQFFDVCDGIFLNYTWKVENLERSRRAAGQRYFDVYVGVDVFGRGCKGGGGFNTIEAVQDARTFSLSVAIFGQGWTFETLGIENFLENDKRFWEILNVGCYLRGISCLPIVTTFCQGWGDRLHVDGRLVSGTKWTNMCQQSLQPIGPQVGLTYERTDVYCGGGSLRLTCTELQKPVNSFKLFDTIINVPKHRDLYISYMYKTQPTVRSGIMLELYSGGKQYVILNPGPSDTLFRDNSPSPEHSITLPQLTDQEIPYFMLQHGSSLDQSWTSKWFKWFSTEEIQLQAIWILLQCSGPYNAPNSICIGSLRVISANDLQLPSISSLRAVDISCQFDGNDHTTITTSMTLSWKCDTKVEYFVLYYDTDNDWSVLGTTSTTAYRVCNLVCNKAQSRFKIQGVYCAGASVPLESAPSMTIRFQQDRYNISAAT